MTKQEIYEATMALLQEQAYESLHAQGIKVTCPRCAKRHSITKLYRCATCHVLFCRPCILKHFLDDFTCSQLL